MDLRQLRALLAVAENGSFSAAARATHTVQSNVSTHIKRLERELGAVLIDRRSGHLTEEGAVAVTRARRIEAELAALTSDVAALHDEVVGEVRLGVIGSISRWLVPDLVTTIRDGEPGVSVVVVDATTTSLVPQLLDGGLDLAVVNLPVTDPKIATEALFDERKVLVAPTDHPLAAFDEVTMHDLAEHRLVLEPRGTAFRDDLDTAATSAHVELRPLAEVDGMTLVASLIFRGYGPGVLPATATMLEPAGDWVRIPIADLAQRSVGLARRRSGRLSAPARAVRDHLRDLIRREAPLLDGVDLAIGDDPVPGE